MTDEQRAQIDDERRVSLTINGFTVEPVNATITMTTDPISHERRMQITVTVTEYVLLDQERLDSLIFANAELAQLMTRILIEERPGSAHD
jgi:hypothetical protein